MVVEDKIKQSKRWLIRIDTKVLNQFDAIDFIGAFLNTVNSIPDHLLEDVSKYYGLDIDPDSKSIKKDFIKKAKESKNTKALDFYKEFKKNLKNIQEKDPIGVVFHRSRNIDTHRLLQKPSQIVLDFGDMVATKDMKPITDPTNPKKIQKYVGEKGIEKISFFLKDLPDTDILEAGKHYLVLMVKFVRGAKKYLDSQN